MVVISGPYINDSFAIKFGERTSVSVPEVPDRGFRIPDKRGDLTSLEVDGRFRADPDPGAMPVGADGIREIVFVILGNLLKREASKSNANYGGVIANYGHEDQIIHSDYRRDLDNNG
jgi:hypothetical protein